MSKYFELHICTFGARNYAHMIAMFLDQDGKFFSHRILSRDECFNPNSKTANLTYVNTYSELLSFWTLSIVRNSKDKKTQRFGNWICFCPQVKEKTTALFERAIYI
jgi:hypothetical protein